MIEVYLKGISVFFTFRRNSLYFFDYIGIMIIVECGVYDR